MFSVPIAIPATFIVLLVILQLVQSLDPVTASSCGIKYVTEAYNLYIEQRQRINEQTFQDRVLEQFYDLYQRVDDIDRQLKLVLFNPLDVDEHFVRSLELRSRLLRIQETLHEIIFCLPPYQNLNQQSNVTILQLADGILDPNLGLPTQLRYLQLLLTENRPPASSQPIQLTDLMLEYFEVSDQAQCSLGKSVQWAMLEYYEKVQLVRIRSAAAVTLAYRLWAKHGGISQASESVHFDEEFRNQSGAFAEVWQAALRRADRRVWRCDPHKHRKHITYEQLHVQQGLVASGQVVNDLCIGSCSERTTKLNFDVGVCSFMMTLSGLEGRCSRNPQRGMCNEEYAECQFLGRKVHRNGSTDDAMHADYLHNEGGNETPGSDFSQDFSLSEQRYCLCQKPKDNWFSRDWVMADYRNEFVVTGIRIHKDAVNSVVRLQIQEGQIEPLGRIQASSIRWKPPSQTPNEGFDRATSNSMSMKKVEAPAGHIIIGVRFSLDNVAVGLQIRTCSFESLSRQLVGDIQDETGTDSLNYGDGFRLANSKVPTRSRKPSSRTASVNRDIEFVATGVEQDFGRNTVPFLDVQEVVSEPPNALTGIGLYHKARPGFGGFVGLELINSDAHSFVERP